MHELSIALSLIDLAAAECERLDAGRLLAVHIKLGPLAGVIKDSLLSAYELAREQSPLSDVELIIEETPLIARCPICDCHRAVVSPQEMSCATCGAPVAEIFSGQELDLTALEFE